MCAICVRYPTDPAVGTSGTQSPFSKLEQRIDHRRTNAGVPMREVVDGGGHDGAHLRRRKWGPQAYGMAHHDISRQLGLFGFAHDGIAQRTHAGIHAIGAHTLPNDGFDEYPCRAYAAPYLIRQFELRAFGHLGRLAPGKGSLEKDALWHRAAVERCLSPSLKI